LLTDKSLKKVPSILDSREAARQRIRDRRITKEEAKALLTERRPSVSKPVQPEKTTEPRRKVTLETTSKTVKPPTITKEAIPEPIQSLPPKTPAAFDDIFSPESQSSTSQRPTAKDTPPPSDLSASATTEPTGRTARRARTAINYAEPSLVSKMRRPTKELLDAVGKDGRALQGAIVTKQNIEKPTLQWKPAYSANAGDVTQRDEAPSPLGSKTFAPVNESRAEANVSETSRSEAESVITLKIQRAHRPTINSQGQASLLDAQSLQEKEKRVDEEEARQAELAIFDFTDSSPSSEIKVVDVVGKGISSRRHSSIGGSDRAKEKAVETQRPTSRSSLGRRKSMMV
jgi:Shugoshin C terminus